MDFMYAKFWLNFNLFFVQFQIWSKASKTEKKTFEIIFKNKFNLVYLKAFIQTKYVMLIQLYTFVSNYGFFFCIKDVLRILSWMQKIFSTEMKSILTRKCMITKYNFVKWSKKIWKYFTHTQFTTTILVI